MEAIAPNTLFGQSGRQGKSAGHLGQAGVESRVETGHLRQRRKGLAERTDTRQVVRLVQRRQGVEARQAFEHRIGNKHAIAKILAAMHHAVRHGRDGGRALQACQQFAQAGQGLPKGRLARAAHRLAARLAGEGPGHLGLATGLQAFDVAAEHTRLHLPEPQRVQGELERGRARVDGKNGHDRHLSGVGLRRCLQLALAARVVGGQRGQQGR